MNNAGIVTRLMHRQLRLFFDESQLCLRASQQQLIRSRQADNASSDNDDVISPAHELFSIQQYQESAAARERRSQADVFKQSGAMLLAERLLLTGFGGLAAFSRWSGWGAAVTHGSVGTFRHVRNSTAASGDAFVAGNNANPHAQ